MSSKRVQSIDASGIRKMFDLAKKCKNPCNLSIGLPDYNMPDAVKEATIQAIRDDRNGYTQTQGIDELREAVLAKYAKKGVPQEDILITAAVTGGFMLSLIATCDPGDEIIIPDPYFIMWKNLPMVTGVTPVVVDTYPDFRWTREKLEAAITPKTKAIVFASPGNPTGVAPTEEELKMIAEVAKKHDLWVLYDEIYELFIYDRPHLDMSRYYEKTITMNGFSKSHAMTGWRVGWVTGPKAIVEEMVKLQQYTYICASSIGQWGAIAALECSMDKTIAAYKKKRDYVVGRLKDHFEIVCPDGAFYLFIKVPTNETADEFVERALKKELILSSGSIFSDQNTHFRLSFGNPDDVLERGLDLLLSLIDAKGTSPYYTEQKLAEV